jgi:hypothetical protein
MFRFWQEFRAGWIDSYVERTMNDPPPPPPLPWTIWAMAISLRLLVLAFIGYFIYLWWIHGLYIATVGWLLVWISAGFVTAIAEVYVDYRVKKHRGYLGSFWDWFKG